jgi:hypothetical protein
MKVCTAFLDFPGQSSINTSAFRDACSTDFFRKAAMPRCHQDRDSFACKLLGIIQLMETTIEKTELRAALKIAADAQQAGICKAP